jgi:hypothetical protein
MMFSYLSIVIPIQYARLRNGLDNDFDWKVSVCIICLSFVHKCLAFPFAEGQFSLVESALNSCVVFCLICLAFQACYSRATRC